MGRELTAIDLFAGAGGVTAGLKAANYRVLAAVEMDRDACATYAANHGEVTLFSRDIRAVTPEEVMTAVDLAPGELGLLTACAPCQGFSTLGKRRVADERNDLLLAVLPWVEKLSPLTLAFENVPRLQADPRFARFVARLRELGYGVRDEPLDAAEFRVPQRRRRLVAVAWKDASDAEVLGLDAARDSSGEARDPVRVRDAWTDLDPIDGDDRLHRTPTYPKEVLDRIKAVPKDGGSRRDLPEELWLACHRRVGTNATSAYGRMRWDDVAPTLTTRCVSPSCGRFLHPEEDRAITLREAAALQTFHPHYVFEGGRMAVEAQIGNAVPVRLATTIGKLHEARILA
jgi:DNA (cytosine-5)-methyltransferase 1